MKELLKTYERHHPPKVGDTVRRRCVIAYTLGSHRCCRMHWNMGSKPDDVTLIDAMEEQHI